MNRKFILVSMLAAAMFATSCSKDENNEQESNEQQQVVAQNSYSITIKATKKSPVSKVKLSDADDNKTLVFENDDQMIIISSADEEKVTPLRLTSGAGTSTGTFTGTITEGGTYFAIIGNQLAEIKSASSLADVVKNFFLVSPEFEIKIDEKSSSFEFETTLTDQNGYVEVDLPYLSNKTLAVNESSFTLNDEGKIWLAVPGGTSVTIPAINGETSATIQPGYIYTLNRTERPTAATPTIANYSFDIITEETKALKTDAITTDMEYSTDDGNTWTDVTTSGEINGLDAYQYQIKIRVKGNDYLNASVAVTVEIPTIQTNNTYGEMQTTVYSLENDTWGTAASYTVNSSISVEGDNIIMTNDGSIYKLKFMDYNTQYTSDVSPNDKVNDDASGQYSWEYVYAPTEP